MNRLLANRGSLRLPGRRLALSSAALAAGGVLPLALAPVGIWPLMLLSCGALFWVLRRTPTARASFWRGWLFGVGKYGVGASWIYVSIHVYGEAPPALAATLVAVFVAGMALFNGLFAWCFRLLRDGLRSESAVGEALSFASLWAAFEWLLSWFLTGFPWLFAGYAFVDTPLAGLAPVGGVLLVSFAAVLTGALLVIGRRHPWGLAIGGLLWLAAWALHFSEWTTTGETRSVALVQGNIPQETKWNAESVELAKARYAALSRPVLEHDLVLWPEVAIPEYRRNVAGFIATMMAQAPSDLVFGILEAEWPPGARRPNYYNAAVSTGGGSYRKRRLVPFGEYVPLEAWLRGVIGFFDLPMSAISRGAEPQAPLEAAGLRLAMAICYEIAYPSVVARDARHADLLATISNDTWFGRSFGPPQHLQIARMRALENGKFLLRATNNGISAIIDDRGREVARLPQFEAGVLTGEISAKSGSTPFARYRNVPLLTLLIVVAVVVVALSRSSRLAGDVST